MEVPGSLKLPPRFVCVVMVAPFSDTPKCGDRAARGLGPRFGENGSMMKILMLCLLGFAALDAFAQNPAQQAGAVLDDWHQAAAVSDEARYFGHFAPNGVYMGTDPTERWT